MAADPTVTAAFEVVAERSGSAPAGFNGLLYLTKTGCPWALLPCEPWKTVYDYFRRWSRQGVWPRVLDQLTQRGVASNGRVSQPSAGCIDSQTIKTATHGKTTGMTPAKRSKDASGICWLTPWAYLEKWFTAADVDDRDGLKQVLTRYSTPDVPRLRKLWVDGGYQGEAIRTWVAELKKTHKIDLEVVAKQGPGFTLLKRRWVVESVVDEFSSSCERL